MSEDLSERDVEYLLAIYQIETETECAVGPKAISERLRVSRPTALEMLKRLEQKKIVKYYHKKGARLTKSGRDLALRIIRRQRILETLLYNEYNLSEDEILEHAIALRSKISDKLIDVFCGHMGHPKFCPHGEPIPQGKNCCVRR